MHNLHVLGKIIIWPIRDCFFFCVQRVNQKQYNFTNKFTVLTTQIMDGQTSDTLLRLAQRPRGPFSKRNDNLIIFIEYKLFVIAVLLPSWKWKQLFTTICSVILLFNTKVYTHTISPIFAFWASFEYCKVQYYNHFQILMIVDLY